MRIKTIFYLAVLPLSIACASLFCKKHSKESKKALKKKDKMEFNEFDNRILSTLKSHSIYCPTNGRIEITAKNFLLSIGDPNGTITAHQISHSFSKIHQHYPDCLYKKTVNGKTVRTNKGYIWVYVPVKMGNLP